MTLGFSPCPNDTFIFDALVNGAIDTGGLQFEAVLEDVQTLNQWASEGRLDITKLSFPALFKGQDRYALLNAGAALGKGVGPLLVARTLVQVPDVAHSRIAIPGEETTANFLLSFAFPTATQKIPYLFSEIEEAVLKGEVDLGVLIHENRFTYARRGLIKVCDLGAVWEEKQQAPIPLGGIAVRRGLPLEVQQQVDRLIRQSLEWSLARQPEVSLYVRQHAQAMEEEVMRQHIGLYVNAYSLDLGPKGRLAIAQLYATWARLRGRESEPGTDFFVPVP